MSMRCGCGCGTGVGASMRCGCGTGMGARVTPKNQVVPAGIVIKDRDCDERCKETCYGEHYSFSFEVWYKREMKSLIREVVVEALENFKPRK